jgi:oligopeptide transport system substrate-binding protein
MSDDARPPQPPTPPESQASRPQLRPVSGAGRFRLLIVAAAILLIASLVGVLVTGRGPFSLRSASTTPGSPSAGIDPPHAPPDKQILRDIGIGPNAGDLSTLDPAQISDTRDFDKAQLVFPELITLDDSGKPVYWAAQRHEVSSDGLTYTFHLRPNMKWSDGAPIDASVFAYSINRALDPCTGSDVASYLYNLRGAGAFNSSACPAGTLIGTSIVVADPLTLQLILERPAAYFLVSLSTPPSWAVPKRLIDQYADKWTDHLADGAGFGGNLYKVTQWDHAGHFALAANDAFWGQQPVLQQIEWKLYKSGGAAWSDYKFGQGDVGIPVTSDLAYARTLPGYTEIPSLAVRFLRVNWALAPFDDVRVRNAFSLAIDRKAITTHVENGATSPTIHMMIKGLPSYNPDLKNAAGDSGDTALSANVPKAQELAKAYAADKCGGDFARCVPVVYAYPAVSLSEVSPQVLVAQALQQMWATAFPGWQITLQGLSPDIFFKSFSRLQLGWAVFSADYPDPQDFLSLLWAKDANYNQSAVDVPEADALERQADASFDATGRLALYQRAEQLLVNQGAFIVYEQPLFSYVVRSSTKLVKWRINAYGVTALLTWQQAYITL